jgi:hypothetical protein
VSATPGIDEWPTTSDVAAILRSRTQDEFDNEIGEFTDSTRPTGDEVEALIAQAASMVLSRTGSLSELPCARADDVRSSARYLISIQTAMLIELGYFPEQVNTDRSPYEHMRDLFNTNFDELLRAVDSCRAGDESGGGESDADVPAPPSFRFMTDTGGMVGWSSRW